MTARTLDSSPNRGCAHVHTRQVGPYWKCTACGQVAAAPAYMDGCPDCEFELHRCGRCGKTLDHTMAHACRRTRL